jgi:hypothetical protein
MRVATFRSGGMTSWGTVDGERVRDARAVPDAPASVAGLLALPEPWVWLR